MSLNYTAEFQKQQSIILCRHILSTLYSMLNNSYFFCPYYPHIHLHLNNFKRGVRQ